MISLTDLASLLRKMLSTCSLPCRFFPSFACSERRPSCRKSLGHSSLQPVRAPLVGKRHRSALVFDFGEHVCLAARGDVVGALSETTEYYRQQSGALLPLVYVSQTEPLSNICDRADGSVRRFVLFSEDVDVQKLSGATSELPGVSVDASQLETVEALKKTPFYQELFSDCPDEFEESRFFQKVAVLPCYVRPDSSCQIAWDIVHLIVEPWRHESSRNTLLQNSRRSGRQDAPSAEVVQAMKQIASECPEEYPAVPETSSWSDVDGFLRKCAVLSPNSRPILEPTWTDVSETECLSGFCVDLDRSVMDGPKNVSLTDDTQLSPLPGAWFLSFLRLPPLWSIVQPWMTAESLIEACGIREEIAVESVCMKLSVSEADYEKTVMLGTRVVKLLTLFSRWQSSDHGSYDNSKLESTASLNETADEVLGKRLKEYKSISAALYRLRENLPLDDWYAAQTGEIPEIENALTIQGYLTGIYRLAKAFKAFVGVTAEAQSLSVAWKICEAVGLVKLQSGSCLEPYLQYWKNSDCSLRSPQPWEEIFFGHVHDLPSEEYEQICRSLGYTFKEPSRFRVALLDPSLSLANVDGYRERYMWLSVLGKAFLDVCIQTYLMEDHPEICQKDINTIFSDSFKQEMCFDLALELRLPENQFHAPPHLKERFAENRDNREALRVKATLRVFKRMTHAVMGSVAADVGFSLPEVLSALKPLLGREVNRELTPKLVGSYET